ncbi:hypothetical protein PAMA_015742 [Pampus argenteus]
MRFVEEEMSDPICETSAVLRVSHLPLVRSALQSVTSAYLEVKGRYPLLGLVGGAAEVGVRSVSLVAMRRATPLLQSLEPQLEVVNSFALAGLDCLERDFPILNQSADEVMGHLRDAFFVTLDNVQLWVGDGVDGALDQLERLLDIARATVRLLQDSEVGRAITLGLDDVLSRLEDATAYYLPLPPTLRQEWEMRVQEYEDADEDEEPGLWTRVCSLMLSLSLQLYHRMMKVREQLQRAVRTLGGTADMVRTSVGLGQLLELLRELLQYLHSLLVALVYWAESLRELTLGRIQGQGLMVAELHPVRQLQQPSQQEVDNFLNQEDFLCDGSSRCSSANSLFLKAMDSRPRRRRSLYSHASHHSPEPPNNRRSSLKQEPEGNVMTFPSDNRRLSATELLLTPLKQFVSQSQKAFEYLSPNSPDEPANAMAATEDR